MNSLADSAFPPMPRDEPQKERPKTTAFPSLGRIVLVRTWGERIGGQDEHAGMIVGVRTDTRVDIMAFTRLGTTRLLSDCVHEADLGGVQPARGDVTWRWPSKV